MEVIKTIKSKVSNNPILTILGGIATYMYITKKMPQSSLNSNKYYLAGSVVAGAIISAYLSSYLKKKFN